LIELDIEKLFDRIDHGLLMKAVRKHTDSAWEILYTRVAESTLSDAGWEFGRANDGHTQGGWSVPS